jgi:hypothetical protein
MWLQRHVSPLCSLQGLPNNQFAVECLGLLLLLLSAMQVALQPGSSKVLGCIDIRLPQTATGMRALGELCGNICTGASGSSISSSRSVGGTAGCICQPTAAAAAVMAVGSHLRRW